MIANRQEGSWFVPTFTTTVTLPPQSTNDSWLNSISAAWDSFWSYTPFQYQDDIPLNSNAQQLFKELGKRVDGYPAVCSVGVTAKGGLANGRAAAGIDLNSSKGVRSVFGVSSSNVGPMQVSVSKKGSSDTQSVR